MRKILRVYLPLILIILAALIFQKASSALLAASALAGMAPLFFDVWLTLRKKGLDLGFPIIVTICVLLFLRDFKPAAVFVLLILAGRALKEYILWRVQESVAGISKELPDSALLKRDGEIVTVRISEIKKGDTVIVKAGGRVPVEGIPGVEQETALGASPIFVSADQKIAGIIFLADAPRSAIQSILEKLKRAGYPLVMLTGDNREVARKIGAELGVTDVKAGFLPQDKIAFIREAEKSGRTVMMVGDGINDAPALAEANVGMAMGLRGVGMTLESAQVVLVHDNLEVLPELFGTARQTFRTIKIDLVLANIIGILGSTIIHQISSSLVLLNTLRLFSIRSRKDPR